MIVNFTVQNYKSIEDRMLLNLTAAKRLRLEGTIPCEKYGMNVLPVTGIYGANSSGKSNLAKAISFMKSRVLGEMTVPVPFLFESDEQERQPSEFSMLLTDDYGMMFHYGFAIYGTEVLEEWLSAYYTRRETVLFTRSRADVSSEFEYYYGNRFIEATEGGRNYLEFTRKGLPSQSLFLAELASRKLNTICSGIAGWFSDRLVVIDAQSRHADMAALLIRNTDFRNSLTDILKEMDFDFDGFEISSKSIDLETFLSSQTSGNEQRMKLRQEIEASEEGVWLSENSGHVIYEKQKDGQLLERRLFIRHKRRSKGDYARLPVSETSSGFLRLLDFASMMTADPGMKNVTVVIDEIERSLHTLISQDFIRIFKKNSLSGIGSQLVFITHDTNLLDLDLLRRDEIQFMEKDRESGSSHITNYAEFKVVPGLNLEKGYLEGRFGAIPIMHHNLGGNHNVKTQK